jgi:predicted RNase H-like nuclease
VRALGVDAAGKHGWVGVVVDDGGFASAHVDRTLAGLVAEVEEAGAVDGIGIDIPIGLVDARVRSVDVAARAYVGPRRASVFPAPHPAVLHLDDHAEVNRSLVALGRPRISVQAFHLFPRIREAVALAHDERVFEAFPEASFRALAGRPIGSPKKTWNGQADRRALLAAASPPIAVPDHLGAAGEVPVDDVLDAAAAAWSALRYAAGRAEAHGDPAELDPVTGRRIAMWV